MICIYKFIYYKKLVQITRENVWKHAICSIFVQSLIRHEESISLSKCHSEENYLSVIIVQLRWYIEVREHCAHTTSIIEPHCSYSLPLITLQFFIEIHSKSIESFVMMIPTPTYSLSVNLDP